MGFYYTTYLCNGNLNDKNVANKIVVATMDGIVEKHEWERGYVDYGEFSNWVKNNLETPINFSDDDGNDLFLMEVFGTSLDCFQTTNTKYILIKNNCRFD